MPTISPRPIRKPGQVEIDKATALDSVVVRALRGREYLRVSNDRSGRMRSPEEQNKANAADAARNGIILGDPYTENEAVSASRYSKKKRDGFERLVSDLRAGAFNADVLILWESSRGSRKVIEWATLLELCEANGILIRVTTHGRTYDPANARDRRTLLEDAVDSEYESGKTSDRGRRCAADNAAAGRPHGSPNWGFVAKYDERKGTLINWEHDPDRADYVKELFDHVEKGGRFRALARDWEARGIVNKSGKPFSPQHLREMCTKPAYTGLRIHRGDLIEGTWKGIVSRRQFWRVQRILSGPGHEATAPRPGKASHEFTRIIKCDVCGGNISVANEKGYPQYRCQGRGCVRIEKSGVDAVIYRAMFAYLGRPDNAELSVSPEETAEVEKLYADLAEMRAERDQAEKEVPATVHEARILARLVEGLSERIGTAERRVRALSLPAPLLDLAAPGTAAEVEARWRAMPVAARRMAAALLLSPAYLGEVRIKPSARRTVLVPAEDRIVWVQEQRAAA